MALKVAVLNTDSDTMEGFSIALTDAGFAAVTVNTRDWTTPEIDHFLALTGPDVIVLEVGPPFDEALRRWNELRAAPALDRTPFVLTTSGRGLALAAFGDHRTEVLEKPFSFDRLVRAVRRAVRRASPKGARSP